MESLKARQKDAGKQSLPVRGAVGGESLDHRAKALQIQKNGNKPEDWLNYMRFIQNSVDFPDPIDRHNFLCGLYDLAIKNMPLQENEKNVALAVLLIDYANLKSKYSPDDAQALLNYARVNMKSLALVHIASAQFKLKQGYQRKCKKLFEKAQMFDVQPASLLQKAMENFAEGKADLLSDEDLDLYIKSEIGTGDRDTCRSGNCSSQASTGTGDWGFAGHSDRQPLSLLPNNRSKLKPLRVKRLEIPDNVDCEDSEEEDSYIHDVEPSEQDNHTRTQGLESMNQSQAGHTSGYVSSVSMTSPILLASEEKERARPDISQPGFATRSQRGLPVIALEGTPMMQCTPNMKPVEELWVNERSYEIFNIVGRGGTSEVYQCWDYREKRNVGIKCVDLSCCDENIIQGYRNEITLLKRLQYSDKVIKMHDYEYKEEMSCLLIVMELADTDLATLLMNASKSKDITPCLMNYYWEAMLTAVKVLHQEGIIHSDLKPANFVLVKGKLKLIDFGIANAIQQDRTSVMRESPMGTLNYISPEAIMDSCGGMSTDGSGGAQPRYKIGVKSDVWSLGCILYNMVYGYTPFQRITNAMTRYQAIMEPSYNIEFRDIPDKALLDVMKQCLIRDVKLRPSIDDLLVHPYLKKTKEPSPVPTPVQSLLDQVQAVANSPNTIQRLENVLEQIQRDKECVGSDLTK